MYSQRVTQIRATKATGQRDPSSKPPLPTCAPIHPILQLQQTIGNQAVQRLLRSRTLQAKLAISRPGDIYEQEADRVAEQVMRMPEPTLQRACAPCAAGGAPCPKCEAEKKELIQRRSGPSSDTADLSVPDNCLHNLGPGQPLDPSTRAFFEPRFGHDFSQVRVHSDKRAAESARAINALAFTVGRNVVFGRGQYASGTIAGQRLLAHELVHVVQQSNDLFSPSIQRREAPGTPIAPAGAKPAPAGVPRPATGRPSPDTRTPQEVYVIDFGVNKDVVNWREAISHIGEIEAESVDQMVSDVMTRVGDPKTNCIRKLTLDGHGSPGSMSVGDGTGWVEGKNISTGNIRPSLAKLTPYFCDGATVVLLGCNVGRGAKGARFIQSLADHWQVNVAAATGLVNGFGIQGVWVWGVPGQVLPSDTMLIVDQIVRILDGDTYGDDEEMIFELLEAGQASGIVADIKAELVRQGRWEGLQKELRSEDEARFNLIFPGKP